MIALSFDLNTLLKEQPEKVLFQAISGSQAYGLAHAQSDVDIRGVFILPSSSYLSIEAPVKQVNDLLGNTVYYSFRRFMELIAQSNPNIIELLYTPDDCIQFKAPFIEKLFHRRQAFISMALCDAFIGFAKDQLKKARGQNKWVNKPQPASVPKKEDFIWFIHNKTEGLPARPVSWKEINIDLEQCHVSSLEHCPNVYRLYHIGQNAQGVFKKEEIVCQSVSVSQEKSCFLGLLVFNETVFKTAKRDFQNYWQWRNNRNEHRWKLQENKIISYDSKNMMHLFRLLLSAEHILTVGEPLVRVQPEHKILLNEILNGKLDFKDLSNEASAKIDKLEELKKQSTIPDAIDINIINELLYSITFNWENR